MKSSGVSIVSRIMRREKSSRRMRRMRTRGNWPGVSGWVMEEGAFSIGIRTLYPSGTDREKNAKAATARAESAHEHENPFDPAAASLWPRKTPATKAARKPVSKVKTPKAAAVPPASLAPDARPRCGWSYSGMSAEYIAYHDQEWGVPVHDDRRLFEFLILEGAQAGLSWSTILRKREGYRESFADFDPAKVARFDSRKVEKLLQFPGIVRNRLKIAVGDHQRAVLPRGAGGIRQLRATTAGSSSAASRS